ncbi:polysaccharide biosynthesis/export family protein [Pacificimonas flava]|uniref:polysaccharide biosynthesis/export family protein n=1 Tax=Pacificimonas flava TaxID=1234595 RepID=UPI0017B0D684|nr:polysaccharide biosynthesis/export family protein [Pacificimonas flava]MBB5281789.1 polysaccharide export outer membrane protein [Pacificimonas flava]
MILYSFLLGHSPLPNMLRLVSVLSASVVLAACATRAPIEPNARLTVVEGQSELPAPYRTDLGAPDRISLIGPLDTIEVNVFGVPDLSRQMQVDGSGRIAMPLIGTVDAGGKTASELADNIEQALIGRYVRDPDVTINILSSVSQVVTIDGEVEEPGLYPVTNQMTLLRAVASARGLGEFADREDVVILRTVDGQHMAGLYDISAIRRGMYDDPPIYANDVVVVGDSPQRRLFRDVISLSPLLASPLVAILR